MTQFLQVAWHIIRPILMKAFDTLWRLNMCNLHSVNEALMILLPKTPGTAKVKDYRPISLIHVIGKLF
jgi:hypothetical protein